MTEHLDRHPNPSLDAQDDPSSPCDGLRDAVPAPRAPYASPTAPDAPLGASYVRVETVAFRRAFDEARARTTQRRGRLAERRPATVARRLALAHRLDAEIRAGVYEDQADVARQHGLTRARLTQLMNLLLLAPDIQEELLALEVPAGREPISERALRPLTETLLWSEQRTLWRTLRPTPNPPRHLVCPSIAPAPDRLRPDSQRLAPEPDRSAPEPDRSAPEPDRSAPEPDRRRRH